MSFDVAADAYGRFMGRYAEPLADAYVTLVDPARGSTALDVGCGPGALTARLVDRLGAAQVAAIDPSESFVAAVRDRLPGVAARVGVAEDLPWPDGTFGVSVAQLVVHFMPDPVAGLREMARVTRPGGRVAACVWDNAGGRGPLSTFWRAARDAGLEVPDEAARPGTRRGHLVDLLGSAGLRDVEEAELEVASTYASFEEWWDPYTLGVGSAGDYLRQIAPDEVAAVRTRCRELLPQPPFTVRAVAWAALGRVA